MWTSKIFGHCTRVSSESSMSILGWVSAWCVSGVNNVTDDFGAEINRELSFRYTVFPQDSCLCYPPYPEY